jgi:hypothetical protein
MTITLKEIGELIQENDKKILEGQKTGNESLGRIDNNLKAFLQDIKNRRGDELEAERERNKLLKGFAKEKPDTLASGLAETSKKEAKNVLDSLKDFALIAAAFAALRGLVAGGLAVALTGLSESAKALKNVFDDRVKTQRGIQRAEAEELRRKSKDQRLVERAEAERLKRQEERLRSESAEANKRQKLAEKEAKAMNRQGRVQEAQDKIRVAEAAEKEKIAKANAATNAEVKRFEAKQREADLKKIEMEAKATKNLQDKKVQAKALAEMRGVAAYTINESETKSAAPIESTVKKPKTKISEISADVLKELEAKGYTVVNNKTGAQLKDASGKFVSVEDALKNIPTKKPAGISAGDMGRVGADTGLRGLNLLDPIGQAEEAARVTASIASKSSTATGASVARAAGTTARVLGSGPLLAAQLALMPSDLADGTRTGFGAKTYNDMILMMREGGPSKIEDIKLLHNNLKQLEPRVIDELGLKDVANMTGKQLEEAAVVLHDQFKADNITRTKSYAGARAAGYAGRGRFASSGADLQSGVTPYTPPPKSSEMKQLEEEVANMKAAGAASNNVVFGSTYNAGSTTVQNNQIGAGDGLSSMDVQYIEALP